MPSLPRCGSGAEALLYPQRSQRHPQRDGAKGIVGEIIGEDLNENVVLHCDDAETIYDFEVVGNASKVFDLERLEVEVLPVGVSPSVQFGVLTSEALKGRAC
jgi:hypothetical protein